MDDQSNSADRGTETERFLLRLLSTTDIHLHLLAYDYYADQPSNTVGLARAAALIDRLRAEVPGALVLDNGDFLQGNPLGDYVALEADAAPWSPHPAIAAMNSVGYDAVTIGNHEFNYGLDFLQAVLADAAFPVISANVMHQDAAEPAPEALFFQPHVMVERRLIGDRGSARLVRIGVLGLCPPQILIWDQRHLQGRVWVADMVEAAAWHAPRLRAAGADLVVALAHTGIAPEPHRAGMENAGLHLAGIEGIDAVICGHQHLTFPGAYFPKTAGIDPEAGRLHGKPAVMAGFWGSHIGVIDLTLTGAATETLRVTESVARLAPIAGGAPVGEGHEGVLAAADAAHQKTLAYIRKPVGETAAPIHSYFAMLGNDPAIQVVNDAQLWYGARLLAGTPWEGLPLLSAASPFKAGGRSGPAYYSDVPAGPMSVKSIADLYLYPNLFAAILLDGRRLREWLERAATVFRHVPAGARDMPLIAPELPSYEFDVIDGVSYRIDLSHPPRYRADGTLQAPDAARIADLCHRGRPVADDDRFVLATNNYRVGGGGYFLRPGEAEVICDGPDTNRDVLMAYIKAAGRLDPAADWNWRLTGVPGSSVVFETGAGAQKVEGGPLDLEPLGTGEGGIRRYRLTFG